MPLSTLTMRAMLLPRLAAGQAAAEVEVVDRVRVEAGHLVQRGLHDQGGQVVGPEVLERPLVGAADGGAGGGDDDCLGHGELRSGGDCGRSSP